MAPDGRIKRQLHDAPLAGGDLGLAAHHRAIVHASPPAWHWPSSPDRCCPRVARIFEASCTACAKSPVISVSAATNRLPKLCPFRAIPVAKAMREQPRQQVLFFAQGHHAVAQIAGRQHVEVLPQPARRTAVVGHRDHGGQVGNGAARVCGLSRAREHAGAVRAAALKDPSRRRWPQRAAPGARRPAVRGIRRTARVTSFTD